MTKRSLGCFLLILAALFTYIELDGKQAAIYFLIVILLFLFTLNWQRSTIQPVLLVLFAYTIAFPVLVLFPDSYPSLWFSTLPRAIDYGMLWSLRGICAFVVGYALVEVNYKFSGTKQSDERVSYSLFITSAIGWLSLFGTLLLSLFGFGLTFIESSAEAMPEGFGQLFYFLALLRKPYMVLYLVLRYYRLTNIRLTTLFLVHLGLSILEIAVVGSKTPIIQLILVFILSTSFLPVRLNLQQILKGIISVFLVYMAFMVVSEYRVLMRDADSAGENVFSVNTQIGYFQVAVFRSIPFSDAGLERATVDDKGEAMMNRLGAGQFSFSNLLEMTNRNSPYENAKESFLVPIYSVIPRLFYPEKPLFFSSGTFAKRYFGWSFGGISVTVPGSFYYAWGYPGVIIGMFILGAALSYCFNHVSAVRVFPPHGIIIFTLFFLELMNVGVTFQAISTNFFRVLVTIWICHRLYMMKRVRVNRLIHSQRMNNRNPI